MYYINTTGNTKYVNCFSPYSTFACNVIQYWHIILYFMNPWLSISNKNSFIVIWNNDLINKPTIPWNTCTLHSDNYEIQNK